MAINDFGSKMKWMWKLKYQSNLILILAAQI